MCMTFGCENEGLYPVIHSGNKVAVKKGNGGRGSLVCEKCLTAHLLEKQEVNAINNHILSVHSWQVTAITKRIDNEWFRDLQRDGYAVERTIPNNGRFRADCKALNSIAKYIQFHGGKIEYIELFHKDTGAFFQIPVENFNATELRPLKDALRQKRYSYLKKTPFFVEFRW